MEGTDLVSVSYPLWVHLALTLQLGLHSLFLSQ
jgi:hypothetical protein